MASPVKLYQREMHDNVGFFATWFPGDRLEVGDVGVLEGGRFRRMASLAELNIACAVDAGGPEQDVRYTSTTGTKLTPSAGADVAGLAKATFTLEFSKSGAFVFHASGLRARSMENRLSVAEQLVNAFNEQRWNEEWLLVDGIHVAERATIVVSQDRSAALTLAADVAGDLLGISLADPSVGLTAVSTRGAMVQIIGERRLHPLYSCVHLKKPLFGNPSMQPVRGAAAAPTQRAFTRPPIDSLLNS